MSRAVTQLGSSGQVVMKYMPRNITPPLILRYGATDVPIIQMSLSSSSLTDTKLNDYGQNIIRPALASVQGASVPYPYGGKPRVVMVDLDTDALQASGLSSSQVTDAITAQNVIAPSGDVKMGDIDYTVGLNTSPSVIDAINAFPVKRVGNATVFLRDVAFVHDGFQVQTNAVNENSRPAALMMVRKTGGASTLSVIDAVKEALPDIERLLPNDASGKPLVNIKPIFDQSIFVKAALNSVLMGGLMAAGLTAIMILLFLGNWRLTLIILASIPLSIIAAVLALYCGGQTLNTMTLGGFALAVGILVDNSTVVIENIERHLGLNKGLEEGIVVPAIEGEVGGNLQADPRRHPGDLHCFRADLPAARHQQISVFAIVAVGDSGIARQFRAVVYAGARVVSISDEIVFRKKWQRAQRPSHAAAAKQQSIPGDSLRL